MAFTGKLVLEGESGFFASQAKRWRADAVARLKAGKGVNGRRLKAKVIPNGKPLGIHSSSGGVAGRLQNAKITGLKSGFAVVVAEKLQDEVFHFGRPPAGWAGRQSPRRFAGIPKKQLKEFAQELADALAKEARRLGVSEGRASASVRGNRK